MSVDAAQNLTKELLDAMGIEPTALEVTTSGRTVVRVSLSDPKDLIGPNGEHLRAFNTIARRVAEVKFGAEAASFLVDVNGYHEEQLEKVRSAARMLAQRARLFKHDVEMEPLSSYERLVVHELFAEDPEIETHSEGEGKFRHIVLKYRLQEQPKTSL